MHTLKEVKQSFADDMYSGLDENDLDSKEEYDNLFKNYIEGLESFDCEGDRENEAWEAGYIRGYEVALKELGIELNSSKDKIITGSFIHYLLTN